MAKNKSTSPSKTEDNKDIKKVDEENVEKKKKEKKDIPKEIKVESDEPIILKNVGDKKEEKSSMHNSPLTIIVLSLTMICSLVFFIFHLIDMTSSIIIILNSLFLTLFSIIYLVVCLTSRRKHKGILTWSGVLLIAFFITNVLSSYGGEIISNNRVQNLTGKNLTEAVKWANGKKIKIIQEYEYSDMVPEYEIISQSITAGTSMKDVEEITLAISEGPNPFKEVVVPSMITWDDERVINFVKKNYLSNVDVEFVESDKVKDTVIEQSKSGNLLRNDELKLTFSYGDEGNSSEVSLLDFTGQSRFEIEFFMKQHHLNYSIEEDYSDTIKKGYGVKQSIKPGEVVKVDGDRTIITISKGPEIKIPNLKNMSITALTEWAIENKLKLEFFDQYDEAIKSGKVISADVNEGDIVEQGTRIKVTVSLGKLKMPQFKKIDDFYSWADKYEIKYEVKHEFSDTVSLGDVISYSYKKGETLKNDEAIVVIISDGAKKGVPDLTGYSKNAAASELESLGLNYNFIYRTSNSSKNTVIGQSISAGSEVSEGTTITITLSSGKSTNSNSGNSGGNNTSTPAPASKPEPEPEPEPEPTPTCKSCTITGIKAVIRNSIDQGYDNVVSALRADLQRQCPGITVNIYPVADAGRDGMFAEGFSQGNTDSCSTIQIGLAKNG